MIDFKNKMLFKLKQEKTESGHTHVGNLLTSEEGVIASFVSMRDRVIFTNKRIICINVQGLTGTKIDYTSIPYSKIQMYSVETSGTIDLDSEIDILVNGLGKIRFELTAGSDVVAISRVISEYVL